MNKKTIIIMGSSRPYGDTYDACQKIVDHLSADIQDLLELVIMPYDYDQDYEDDDFLPFMKRNIKQYDHIVLATPVYWYSMSGIMKNFLDRWTDLVTVHKSLGRQLSEKTLSSISVSKLDDCPDYFHRPFQLTAKYMKMDTGFHIHLPANDSETMERRIQELSF